jgi:hypothetical protein
MAKTPDQVMQKYSRGMAAAGQSYRDGVQNPGRSWSQSYLSAVPRMVEGLRRSIEENRPQNAVRQLGDTGWQQQTLAKADRYTASATRATEAYGAVVQKVISAGERARQAALAIDGTTLEGRLQRMPAAVMAIMREWGRTP